MTSTILTVEAAAALLQLHPKTVLRFIREGRLRASRHETPPKKTEEFEVLHMQDRAVLREP
mgnify:CR=1 FL=1